MKLEITVPSSLDDITLRQYKEYERVLDTNKEDVNAEHFLNLKMLEIFCGVPLEVVNKMKAVHYEEIVNQLYDVLTDKPELVRTFKMGDSTFGFIPNLEDMSFGEYVDLDTYIGDMKNIEKAMAVLYRPIVTKIKNKYIIDEYKGDLFHEAMLNMPMSAVISSIVFFYNLGIDLSSVMMSSLQPQQQEYLRQKGLATSGVGINQSMHSLKEMLEDLKIYPN